MQKIDLKAIVAPKKKERIKLPLLLWYIFVSTIIVCIGGSSFLGFNVTGFAWAVPFFLAVIIFLTERGRMRFPFMIWLPGICVVAGYLIFAEAENAFQRSVMLLCPLFIGITASKFKISDNELSGFRKLYRYMVISLYAIVILKTGLFVTGVLSGGRNLAAPVMTGALLCALFATNYMFGEKRDLAWWGALSAIPIIALTRMGMIATELSLPLTFAPMKMLKRIVLASMIIAAGYGLFYTERVQEKTFSIPGAGLSRMSAGIISILRPAHNDWLRLLFDYGYFGTVIFGITMVLQVFYLIRKGK